MTARVAWLTGPGALAFREEPLAEPGPGEVLCRTLVSVISPGTELAAWLGLPPLRPGPVYPRLMGYCNVAEVVTAGPESGLAVGDRVLGFESHRSAFVTKADAVWPLPDGDPTAFAATYLFHLGLDAVNRAEVRQDTAVAVVGLGPLGLGAVAMARLAGGIVTAVSDRPSARSLAMRLGAAHAVGRNEVGDGTADVVVATTGGWGDWQLALRATAVRGRIAVLGFPGRGQPAPTENPLASRYFYDKQLRIEAVGMAGEQAQRTGMERLIALIAEAKLDARALVSTVLPADDLAAAYAILAEQRGDAVTIALDWRC